MSSEAPVRKSIQSTGLREKILSEPELVLDDPEVMRALVEANDRTTGKNVVDLRAIAMDRLEARFDRLEDTHRSVIAAAYENLAGTNLVHDAVLSILEAPDLAGLLARFDEDMPMSLRVARIRLILESSDWEKARLGFERQLSIVEPGAVTGYITNARRNVPAPVTLRQVSPASAAVYGEDADYIRSECVLHLDLGPNRLPGMLVLGSEDPHQFRPNQGTDLLAFMGAAFERVLRRFVQ